jgi:putative NADH-flavin reductase
MSLCLLIFLPAKPPSISNPKNPLLQFLLKMKNIVVFGATGPTGREFVKQALEEGHELTVIVRDPISLNLTHHKMKVIKGDVLECSSFENEMVGKDVVISCLGSGGKTKTTIIYSKGMENIISTMGKSGINRLICISAMGLSTNDNMGFLTRILTKFVAQKIYKEPYKDMRLMEKILENANLEWTILKPPALTNKAKTGTYRLGINEHISRPFSISRADLADFMLRSIDDSKTFRAKVEIAY